MYFCVWVALLSLVCVFSFAGGAAHELMPGSYQLQAVRACIESDKLIGFNVWDVKTGVPIDRRLNRVQISEVKNIGVINVTISISPAILDGQIYFCKIRSRDLRVVSVFYHIKGIDNSVDIDGEASSELGFASEIDLQSAIESEFVVKDWKIIKKGIDK
jgi:hypothetical protein